MAKETPELLFAREAHARLADKENAPSTASLYRDGSYDEGGSMPVATEAARLAREADTELLQVLFDRLPRPRRVGSSRGRAMASNENHCAMYDRLAERLGQPGAL